MAITTEHYNLTKPQPEEYYDVSDFNENMDEIDAQLALREAETAEIGEKLGSPADTQAQTVFGALNRIEGRGGSLIRSIQRIVYTRENDKTGKTLPIATVDPAKTIVLMERLYDSKDGTARMYYSLSADAIHVQHGEYSAGSGAVCQVGFWVVEFQ